MLKPEEHFGKMYQPVEGGDCDDCQLMGRDNFGVSYCTRPYTKCTYTRRSDGLNVHYINIEGE